MINTYKFITIIVMILIMAILITGCWDNKDLTQLGIAVAIGIDKAQDDNIKATVQLVKADVLKARQKGSEENAVWIHSSTGKTLFSAIRNLLTTVNRKVFFGHLALIVINEKVAKEGITNILDFFERDHEPSKLAKVLIAKNIEAVKVLSARSELENIPAMHLKAIMENNSSLAKIKNINEFQLLKYLNHTGHAPIVGVIYIKDELKDQKVKNLNKNNQKTGIKTNLNISDFKIQGSAVFKKDQLVGWLDPIETRGLLFAQNEVKDAIVNLANPLNPKKDLAFEIIDSKGKMDVELKNDKLNFLINIKTKGKLGQQQGSGELATVNMVNKIEKLVEVTIKNNIQKTVDLAQSKYKLDLFGFAEKTYKKYPDYFNKHKDDWEQIFTQVPVAINVNCKMKSTGLITEKTKNR